MILITPLLILSGGLIFAQNCSWQDTPIGNLATGSAYYDVCDPVTADITTTAYSYSNTADEQYFVYRELCGDGELIVELDGLSPTTGRYGIEFRSGTEAGAMKFGLKKAGTGNSVTKMSRTSIDGSASYTTILKPFHNWLKITRVGDQFTAYTSQSGSSWSLVYTITISMDDCIVGGMFAHGPNIATNVSGSFGNISFEGDGETQELFYCGSAPKLSDPEYHAEELFNDRFGNSFTFEQIKIKTQNPSGNPNPFTGFIGCGCDGLTGVDVDGNPVPDLGENNYFDLWFEDCDLETGAGFNDSALGEERRRVVCQAFYDIAQLIMPSPNICTQEIEVVNVQIMPSELGNAQDYYGEELPSFPGDYPSYVLGYATPYPYLEQMGIVYGLPWIIINSGERPIEGNYDGLIRINFSYDINWNLDYQSENFSSVDLYSVSYHEALHLLDFLGSLSSNGKSIWHPDHPDGLGGYSEFTRHLIIEDGDINNQNDVHFIYNNPQPSINWYNNTDINFDDFSECDTEDPKVVFQGTEQHYPIYTGNSYELGSSFSHLEIDCNNYDINAQYLMNPDINAGVKRRITSAEKDILRKIGYHLSEGENNCSVAGVSDNGPYFEDSNDIEGDCNSDLKYEVGLCNPGVLNLFVRDLIFNDPGATGILFLETQNSQDGNISGPMTIDGLSAYQFHPNQLGQIKLIYVPIGCDGNHGNLTYVTVRIFPDEECLEFCEEYISCSEWAGNQNNCYDLSSDCELNPDCNLICNPKFCGSMIPYWSSPLLRSSIQDPLHSRVPNWYYAQGTGDIVVDNFFDPSSGFAHMASGQGTLCGPYTTDPTGNSIVTSEGLITFVDIKKDSKYLLGFASGNINIINDSPSATNGIMKVVLIEGQNMSVEYPTSVCPIYDGIQEQPIMEQVFNTPLFEKHRTGSCFVASNDDYNALWFYPKPSPDLNNIRSNMMLDDVELIEDLFTAGGGDNGIITSPFCGAQIELGEEFCMLSDVTVTYEWFEVDEDENGNEVLTSLVNYKVSNGGISEINPSGGHPFDSETRVLTVAPLTTTKYRLVRSIFDDDGFAGFEFCETQDDVIVQVTGDVPSAEFSYYYENCIFVFTPLYYSGQIATWTIDGEEVDPGYVYDGTLIKELDNGQHTISLILTNTCNQQSQFDVNIFVNCNQLTCACDSPENAYSLELSQQGITLSSIFDNGVLPEGSSFNGCLTVSGTLIIDQDYNIFGEVIMNSDALIIVNDGVTFTLDGANVHGCDYLWEGIINNSSSSNVPNLICVNSTITDAKTAIKATWASSLKIQNTDFDKNLISIKFSEGDLADFYGNVFDCSGDLLEDINLGVLGYQSYCGMEISGKTICIGVEGQIKNVFQNIRNGIHCTDCSSLSVVNTQFQNVQPDPVDEYDIMGFGILHESQNNLSYLFYQRGFGNDPLSDEKSFNNCHTAIFLNNGGDVNVSSNNIQETVVGVKIDNSHNTKINIKKNYIESISKGVELLHNDPLELLNVSFNIIDLIGLKTVGIYVDEMNNEHTQAVIEENRINGYGDGSGNGVHIGISMRNTNNIRVNTNYIYLNTNNSAGGISLRNGEKCELSCNHIYGSNTTFGIGIDIWNTVGTQYECNYFKNLKTGMKFTGVCNITGQDSNLKANTFDPPLATGLHYSASAVMNMQSHKGNIWNGVENDYGDKAARHDGSNPTFIFDAQYVVHALSPPFYPPSINSFAEQASWFVLDPTGNPEACQMETDCPIIYIANPEIGGLVKKVALDQQITTVYPATGMWTAQRTLHTCLKENQSMLGEDLDVDLFYNSAEINNVGKFNELERSVLSLWVNSGDLTNYVQITELLAINMEDLVKKDALLAIEPSSELKAERDSLSQVINTQIQSLETLRGSIESHRANELDNLKVNNNSIVTSEVYENNEKQVNAIYLNTIVSGGVELNSSEQSILASIAQQCPLEGGKAVYKARALYALVDEVEYDDEQLCGNTAFEQSIVTEVEATVKENLLKEAESQIMTEFHLYPNPVKDLLTMEYRLTNQGYLIVQDIYGRELLRRRLSSEESTIIVSTRSFANGVYLIKVIENMTEVYSSRVIIQK